MAKQPETASENKTCTYAEEAPIGVQSFGGQRLDDVLQHHQRALLLLLVRDLDRLEQRRYDLGPVARTVEPRDLGDERRNLDGDLLHRLVEFADQRRSQGGLLAGADFTVNTHAHTKGDTR